MNHTTARNADPTTRFAHLGDSRYGMLPVAWMPHLKGDQMIKVFWALCAHANADGTCFPSRKAIAEMCGIHPNNIPAILRKLEAIKAISTVTGSGRRPSFFHILPPTTKVGVVDSASSEVVEDTTPEVVKSTTRNRPRTDHVTNQKNKTHAREEKPVDNFLKKEKRKPDEKRRTDFSPCSVSAISALEMLKNIEPGLRVAPGC